MSIDNTTNNNDVALLVHTCDRYALLYKGFEFFFHSHWDHKIRCSSYFATEEKSVQIRGFVNVKSGNGQWSDRLAFLLKQIPEKYILYMQEDMWLSKDVNENFFKQLFNKAVLHQWKQVKLHSSEVYKTIDTSLFIDGFQIAKLDNKASDFLMSHQITLWDKTHLLAQLSKGEHPWRNERRGTKRLKKTNQEIFLADYFAENGKPPVNLNDRPIQRSEYNTISINGTLDSTILPYINVLMKGDEDDQKYANKLLSHYRQGLTHDGKPKPRKEDLFKRITKWLKLKTR